MMRTRYYLGLTDKDGQPVPEATVADIGRRFHSGCTLYQATGWWEGNTEPSVVIETLTEGRPEAERLAGELQELANQTSVLWTQEWVRGGFTS